MKKEVLGGWLLIVSTWLFSFEVLANTALKVDQTEPKAMVQQLSQLVVTSLNERRSEFETDTLKIIEFAQTHVLPYVDTEKMARYALGKNWRSATTQQQQDFTRAFTENLIRSYSQSFLNLKIDKVDVGEFVLERPGRGTVSSTIYQQEGKPAGVLYRVFADKDNKWYLYDVVIENVSMLLSYRNVYGSAVASKGLDQVIQELEQKNQQATTN